MTTLSVPRTCRLLLPLFVMVGLTLRAYHYGRDRAVWQDEAGLLLTVTARDYHDLFLGRLDYHQAAPPLYLWTLKTVALLRNDSSYALRLPSFLASCAALLLFAFVAKRMLSARAAAWAVLWFAVSEQLLWHASEAKAYSVDVLAAAVVLALPCCRCLASLPRQMWAYTLIAPLLLLSSYPAMFLCTGLLLAYLPVVVRKREGATWLAYGALAATTGTILLGLLLGPVRSQHDAEIHSCWVACMPNWHRLTTVPSWFLLAPFEVCRYCCKPLGQFLTLFAALGASILWRAGDQTKVRIMLAPILLALGAACFHAYPFGGARVMVYAAPAILLLAAAGVPPVLTWLRDRNRLACAVPIVLLLMPVAASLGQVVRPWTEADIPAVAAFVQAQRRADDLILGNDVAQQYYFRRLGSAFHLLDESPFPAPTGDRLWILMTAALSQAERERLASPFVPLGWRLGQHQEFAFTTVLLFTRRSEE
jgi:hypothetical protein